MSTEGLIIGLGLLLIVGAWTLLPWLRRSSVSLREAQQFKQQEQLNVLYERVLTNIRDLDEDYATGKINSEAYEEEREMWVQRGVQVLRVMDEHGELDLDLPPDTDEHMVDDAIEAAIAAYRQKMQA